VTVSPDLALATRDLRKSYGSRVALAGLDLSVPTGVVYGFLGPNGAGKTTTMRLLTGLLHPDSGSIHLLGSPFARGDRRRLFRVGALVESPSFYPYLNGRQNLHALAATGAPVPKNRVEELLELVGLRDRATDKVSGYSLGMKQRLGIAAAMLGDPRVLVLDEPANGLDPEGIRWMREFLQGLAAEGRTVLVSSHLLSEMQALADDVVIVAAGRLVRQGAVAEVLASMGGDTQIQVGTPDPAKLADALRAVGAVVRPAGPHTLVVTGTTAAVVGDAALAAGVAVHHLSTDQPDLEDVFLSLTTEKAAIR
jgi:ABC-2 type transport system ATP-binding protein